MIDKLRRRMICICCSAVLVAFALIFTVICVLGYRQLDSNMDIMTDRISEGNGVFRPLDEDEHKPEKGHKQDFITEETPYSTRFFTVWFSKDGEFLEANMKSVSSVSEQEAREYAQTVLDRGDARGWEDNFRYKVFHAKRGTGIVFVEGSMNRATTQMLLLTAAGVLLGCAMLISLVIVLVSKRVVRPIAESYEKQKQFVTDASHELKTPLTLVLTNLDIVEAELGHSEWLDDIRSEGRRMSSLVAQLIALSRMDEGVPRMEAAEFSFSDVCSDAVSEFSPLVESKGLKMSACIQLDLSVRGDEGAIRRLVAILLDNAVKYCDPGGDITFWASGKRQTELRVENTCAGVDNIQLSRLFDRFYREDKARTAGNSFGIGLSLAKSIAENHRGEIKAYKAGPNRIGFRVVLK